MRILPLQKLLSLIVVMCASVLAFAQPANDDCSTPTLLVVGADAASCIVVAGDTRETVDSRNVNDPLACSVNWVADDVWYTIETGATIPQDGITIEKYIHKLVEKDFVKQDIEASRELKKEVYQLTKKGLRVLQSLLKLIKEKVANKV